MTSQLRWLFPVLFACGGGGGESPPDTGDPGCEIGSQDRDGDGTCTAACTETACSGVGACDDSSGTLACACETGYAGTTCAECAPSYVLGDNGACVFGDPIANGTFEATGAPWQVTGLATISGGRGVLPASDPDQRGGTIHQTFQMPPREAIVPRAIELDLTPLGPFVPDHIGVIIAGGYHRVPTSNAADVTVRRTLCLGDSAYGGDVKIVLVNDEFHRGAVAIDNVRMVTTTTAACPVGGTLVNGTFAEQGAGWTIEGPVTFGPEGATIASNLFGEGAVTGWVSIPTTGGALDITYTMIASDQALDRELDAQLAGFTFARLPISTGTTARVCIPPWARGTSQPLTLRTLDDTSSVLNGTTTISQVALVSDPACETAGMLLDPGLETGRGWSRWRAVESQFGILPTPIPTIIDDPAGAFEGTSYARSEVELGCEKAFLTTTTSAPPAPGDVGLRLSYAYKFITTSTVAVVHGPLSAFGLPAATDWTVVDGCLARGVHEGGRPFILEFQVRQATLACNGIRPLVVAQFDGIKLTPDATCP